MEYGFILPKNLHDTVTFSRDLVYSVVIPEISGISKRKKEVISFNELDKQLFCSEENCVSWSTLVLFRVLAMDENGFKRDWQKVLTGEPLGDEVELRVLQWKQCLIRRVLECYEHSDKDDVSHLASHDPMSVNMHLALQLRKQEKQILRNVLEMVTFPQDNN